MKNFLPKVLLALSFVSLQVQASDVLITNGRLVTDQGIIEDGQILVRDGKIAEVGTSVSASGVDVVDVGGAFVTPGLFDSSTQVGLGDVQSSSVRSDHRVRGTDLGAGFAVGLAINRLAAAIPIARMEGVTRALIRPSHSDEVFAGQSAIIDLGEGDSVIVDASNAVFVYLGEEGLELSAGSRAKGLLDVVDSLKEANVYRKNRRDYERRRLRDLRQSQLDLDALVPVVTGNKPLAVYADRASDIEMIIDQFEQFDIKLVIVGAREAWQVSDLLVSQGIPVIVNPMENLPSNFDQLGARLDNPALLAEAGVLFGYMTEDETGEFRTLTQGAGVSVANGLSWQEAVNAITINPARIWGIDDSYGALRAGLDADIVVWDGDPLEVMSAPTRLMIKGEWVELDSRQLKLRDRYSDLSKERPPFGYR